MMRLFTLALSLIVPSAALAAGYTHIGPIAAKLGVKEHILTFIFVSTLFVIAGLIYRAKVSGTKNPIIPDIGITFRNIFEAMGQFIYNLAVNIMGEESTKKYYTVIMFFFALIFANNCIGLIPGFLPPTENFNTTLALGTFVFIYYNYQGIRAQGLWGHIKHFMGPVWYLAILILPIELISHGVRPLSLGLRLKGNMEGDHLVLSIFSGLIPYIVPIPFYIIGLFVCFMQAFVFTLLTMVYISLATAQHDHDEEHAH